MFARPFKSILYFTFLLLTNANLGYSQFNYIPNYSFEVYDTCPSSLATVPYRAIYYAKPWFQPFIPGSSTDLFNVCDTNQNSLGVPNNYFGSQIAQDGQGYAGFASVVGVGNNYREYLEVELLSSLIAGRKYCLSFYVCLAGISSFSSDGLDCHFSDSAIYYSSPFFGVINLSSQVESPPGLIISDTLNWTNISGEFVAIGGEKYLTIGNFEYDSSTTISFNSFGSSNASYYYIDNLKLFDCDSVTGLNSILPDLSMTIFPVPTSTTASIQFVGEGKTRLEVFSLDGRKLYEQQEFIFGDSVIQLETNNMENGLYFVRLWSGGKLGTVKLLVQH